MPQPPAWARDLIGRSLAAAFPNTAMCVGNTDSIILRYAGTPEAVKVVGWGWDLSARKRIDRIILVDTRARIVGAGEGGLPRPDVPAGRPEIHDPNTGWQANAPLPVSALDAYGVISNGSAICRLGHIQI
jgi:hypothetical protein